jgi:acyl-CoA synthetase (NDP forming)
MVVDRLGAAGIELARAPAHAIERLADAGVRIKPAPVIDLPMGRADDGAYAAVLGELLVSDHCDLVLAVQGSNATYIPESVRERILAAKRGAKPLAVFAGPRAERALALLHEHGVAAFRTPESCAAAIQAYFDWRAPQAPTTVPTETARLLHDAVRMAASTRLNEHEASALLAILGIAFAPSCVVQTSAEPVDLGFPVAAKLLSRDLAHKTDLGGVLLDIPDASALARAVDQLLTAARALGPGLAMEGILVQTMQRGLGEAMVGYRRDPQVGPIVLVGAGGIAAEYAGTPAIRLAPVDVATAAAMIDEVAALTPLRGFRGRPRGDLEALAWTIHRLSLAACEPRILEAEINPLIVASDAVVAVDALVRLHDPSALQPA